MNKFKVGDKVKIIKEQKNGEYNFSKSLKKGDTFIIGEVSDNKWLRQKNGDQCGVHKNLCKLIKSEKSKFKVGDIVECIDSGDKGAGWKLNHKFRIIRVSSIYDNQVIYWGGINGDGIHENSLKLSYEYKLNNKKKGGYIK
uniref:Uncharacterized protein n=1 Tax=viral metagenome TaxID=1070528 RepID=A0A6M3LNH0_9ZZZZ